MSMRSNLYLGIPNVMLTVLGTLHVNPTETLPLSAPMHTGVVIGFVISYRASSGCAPFSPSGAANADETDRYDRYWMGRTAWSEVTRNTRTLSRLIWFHIPLRLTPKASPTEEERPMQEIHQVMKEKRRAIDVLEGYVWFVVDAGVLLTMYL